MKLLLTICLLFSFSSFGQLEYASGMYWNNYSSSNPAMTGVNYKHEANIIYRSIFDKVNGAPTEWNVNYGLNLGGKHGIGINYVNESIGFESTNRGKINYNYQFKLKENRKLAVGTAVSFGRIGISPEWANCEYCSHNLIYVVPQNFVDIDLGVSYYGKNISAGLALTQLPIYESSDFYETPPYLVANFRYVADAFGSSKALIFETRFRTEFIKYTIDYNIGYNYKNIIEAGIGFRTNDAVLFNLTGTIVKKFRIGYSYALPINQLSTVSRGTHEFALGLRIPNK